MYNSRNNQLFKNLGALLNNIQVNSGDISGTQVNLAKAIFIQNDYNITTNFKMIAKEFLNSELITVDFKLNGHQAQKTINQYVLFIIKFNTFNLCNIQFI